MTYENRGLVCRLLGAVIGLALVATGTSVAGASAGMGGTQAAFGTLDLQVTFGMVSSLVSCPADTPPDAYECRARTATALARGLGRATEIYGWSYGLGPPTCPGNLHKPFATTGRLVVAGKGEITFALAEGARCFGPGPVQDEPQELTITGGTGPFAGASGRGTVGARSIGGGVGTETWTATLDAPGLDFDLTSPVISGAANKTVKTKKGARSARVSYRVTAQDDKDGAVPVTCLPRSGSRFTFGRTKVTCEAFDTSANTATSSFTVTVKRTR
jgi:hypothetical protein